MAPPDPNREEEEINSLLSLNLEQLDDLDLDESEDSDSPPTFEEEKAEQGFLEEWKDVPAGKSGFDLFLQQDKSLLEKEEKMAAEEPEIPLGADFQKSIAQIKPSDRSESYKKNILGQYNSALKMTQSIYSRIAKGDHVGFSEIRGLVETFLKTMISDRCILLNLSMVEPPKGDYLFHHVLNNCLISLNMATAGGFSRDQILEIGQAGLLADIGMMFISPQIRFKTGKLTEMEYYDVLKHPMLGIHALEKIGGLPSKVAYVAYQHHERMGGGGYPKNRKGNLIHTYSRLVATADIFGALCSARAYRPKIHPAIALKNLLKMGQIGLLNSQDVMAFVRFTSLYPVGCFVQTSEGQLAKVIEANPNFPEKPTVSILEEKGGKILDEAGVYQVDLAQDSSLHIKGPADAKGNFSKWNVLAGM